MWCEPTRSVNPTQTLISSPLHLLSAAALLLFSPPTLQVRRSAETLGDPESRMRAVTGSVVSSAPVSLKRAAAVISDFVVADTGARPEIAVNCSRASRTFNELLELHREIRSTCGGGENDDLLQQWEERHSKRKRKEIEVLKQYGDGSNRVPGLVNRAAEMDVWMMKISKERSGMDEEGSSHGGGVEKMKKERVVAGRKLRAWK